jgi:ATP-dependent Lon protease
MIKTKYFKDKHEIVWKQVPTENLVGIGNGMWANSVGQGGIIPIQTKFYPASGFLDIKLTGLQGDVMKESMNVALTLAWNMTDQIIKDRIFAKYNKMGIHINTPEGSVQKDGPSAGGCITTTIFSLLNNKKIKSNFAQTGEISLDGNITAIGGLDLKILGSIKSGVTHFIYPEENKKDFNKFIEKYKNKPVLQNIQFYAVKHINDVFELIFE